MHFRPWAYTIQRQHQSTLGTHKLDDPVDAADDTEPDLMEVLGSTHTFEMVLGICMQGHVNDGVEVEVQVVEPSRTVLVRRHG